LAKKLDELDRARIQLDRRKPTGTSQGVNAKVALDRRPVEERALEAFKYLDQNDSKSLEEEELGVAYGDEIKFIFKRFKEKPDRSVPQDSAGIGQEAWIKFWSEILPSEVGEKTRDFLMMTAQARIRAVERQRRKERRDYYKDAKERQRHFKTAHWSARPNEPRFVSRDKDADHDLTAFRRWKKKKGGVPRDPMGDDRTYGSMYDPNCVGQERTPTKEEYVMMHYFGFQQDPGTGNLVNAKQYMDCPSTKMSMVYDGGLAYLGMNAPKHEDDSDDPDEEAYDALKKALAEDAAKVRRLQKEFEEASNKVLKDHTPQSKLEHQKLGRWTQSGGVGPMKEGTFSSKQESIITEATPRTADILTMQGQASKAADMRRVIKPDITEIYTNIGGALYVPAAGETLEAIEIDGTYANWHNNIYLPCAGGDAVEYDREYKILLLDHEETAEQNPISLAGEYYSSDITHPYPSSGVHAAENIYKRSCEHYLKEADKQAKMQIDLKGKSIHEAQIAYVKKCQKQRLRAQKREELIGCNRVQMCMKKAASVESAQTRKELDDDFAVIQERMLLRKHMCDTVLAGLEDSCSKLIPIEGGSSSAEIVARVEKKDDSAKAIQGGIRGSNVRAQVNVSVSAETIQGEMMSGRVRQQTLVHDTAYNAEKLAAAQQAMIDGCATEQDIEEVHGMMSKFSPIKVTYRDDMQGRLP